MGKPWGRYEIGYLGGSKFRALHANAICLWWEIKSYCDEHLNDGRFPATIIGTFRFYATKPMAQLTHSCGLKPNGSPFAPLIETQAIGGVNYYVMHDYLDHNDCREAVLKRIAQADAARSKRAADQQAYRDRQKAERDRRNSERDDNVTHNAAHNEVVTRDPRYASVGTSTETPTPTQTDQEQIPRRTSPPRTSAMGPLPGYPRLRVFRWMVDRMLASLGAVEFPLEEWLLSLENNAQLVIPTLDKERWEWLQRALDYELRTRGLLTSGESGDEAKLKALVANGPSIRPHRVGK